MMSSEEETDCFGLYGDKLLKKQKRARQRVDAGEPRNSYSSIPNFTSRPSFMSGGLYGAIFSQNQQHFGLFGPGYGPAKMLNELLGRQAKALEASPQELPGETAAERQGAAGLAPPDLAHHMLRDILQGRKKELLQLEREMRGVAGELGSPDNNNSINNNNNNEIKNGSRDISDNGEVGASGKRVNGIEVVDSSSGDETSAAAAAMQECLQEAGMGGQQQQAELLDEVMSGVNGGGSDSGRSLPSPPSMEALVTPKVEIDVDSQADKEERASPTVLKNEPVPLDMKRARVENIVSTMRSSPVPAQPQVNGCKKRKLYQPQQHDNSAAERYAAAGLGLGLNLQSLMLDDDDDEDMDHPPIHQKIVEKNALKSQLRTMQEQLAEMQQKYVQLCNRMEQESDTQENEEINSDNDQDASNHAPKSLPRSPASSPIKEQPATPVISASSTPNMLTQVMSKMMSSKGHPHMTHSHGIPPNFNGAIPMMQHMSHVPNHESALPHPMQHPHANSQHPHHAISNAAAMYLGVSQKLFMEQEVRQAMAKEAAVAAAHAAEQHHQQAAQHHHQQQQHQHHQQQQHLHQQQQQQEQQHRQNQQNQHSPTLNHHVSKTPNVPNELTDRLSIMRNNVNSIGPVSGADLEGLADVLKTEISASLSNLVDSIVTRFVHQRRYIGKQTEAAAAAAEQLNKDLMLASQLLERKSPRLKSADRPNNSQSGNAPNHSNISTNQNMTNSMLNHPNSMNNILNSNMQMNGPRMNGSVFPPMSLPLHMSGANSDSAINQMSQMSHMRPSPSAAMFQAPKPPQSTGMGGGIYGGMNHLGSGVNPFCMEREQNPEQNEALSLVVTPKKKRHKVTDTRITPRTVSRILAQDGPGPSPGCPGPADSPSPRPYHPAPSMLPVSLPTSVAIPNPSLHESQVFSPYSPFFGHHGPLHAGVAGAARLRPSMQSPPSMGMMEARDSPPLPHAPALLHPALLAAARHAEDYSHPALRGMDIPDSDCNSTDLAYDGVQPTSSTLTPMHLRKAKLMFFWVRYPSSAVLKMYFPDIKFNKNNTAQLVKWFSNFREFYYIQMEKYARQAVSEGVKNADELHVAGDSEIYRVLNLHYNRNNHIEVPSNFRYVVEQTLREFFRAIQGGKDAEQSWKKSIYKVISRLDDPVPEYFKSPNFLEQLE